MCSLDTRKIPQHLYSIFVKSRYFKCFRFNCWLISSRRVFGIGKWCRYGILVTLHSINNGDFVHLFCVELLCCFPSCLGLFRGCWWCWVLRSWLLQSVESVQRVNLQSWKVWIVRECLTVSSVRLRLCQWINDCRIDISIRNFLYSVCGADCSYIITWTNRHEIQFARFYEDAVGGRCRWVQNDNFTLSLAQLFFSSTDIASW